MRFSKWLDQWYQYKVIGWTIDQVRQFYPSKSIKPQDTRIIVFSLMYPDLQARIMATSVAKYGYITPERAILEILALKFPDSERRHLLLLDEKKPNDGLSNLLRAPTKSKIDTNMNRMVV